MIRIRPLTKGLTFSKSAALIAVLSLTGFYTISCTKSGKNMLSESNIANKQKIDATNSVIEVSTSDDENFDMETESGEFTDAALNAVASTLSGKVTVTYNPSKDVFPHTKTIDYGTGYTNSAGVTRSGKIIITYSDPGTAEQKSWSTAYDHYYVNNLHIEGGITTTKTNTAGQVVYLSSMDKTITDTTTDDVKSWHGSLQRTVINWQGGTANAYQIIQSVVGKETYKGVEAHNFRADVDDANPVIQPFKCRRAKGGMIININVAKNKGETGPPTRLKEYLDYGNGECDNLATLSINGSEPQTVTLPLRFWPLSL